MSEAPGAERARRSVLRVIELALFLGAVVMINVTSSSTFTRFDLTEERLHSLSPASIDVVSSLREPLTIRAFFSSNLPAPYNTIEQAVRDLLDEYAVHGGDLFNYQFITMGAAEAGQEAALANEELARGYLIRPIQIERLDRDEVTLSNVYTGLALIHGDQVETIPSITNSAQLEFILTEAMTTLTRRVSRLLALEEQVEVRLYFSSLLGRLSPDVEQIPTDIAAVVQELNGDYYDRLAFGRVDPDEGGLSEQEAAELGLAPLNLRRADGGSERVYAGLTVAAGDSRSTLNLVQTGLFGYQFLDLETIRDSLDDTLKSLLGTQEEIGYLADYGTPPFRGRDNQAPPPQLVEPDLAALYQLVAPEYAYRGVLLEQGAVPEGLRSLLVVAPQQPLSDWALFQIDQFLLGGGSLLLFLDSHDILLPRGGGGGGPFYLPRDTGLEAMLEHYGVRLKQSYVLDEQSYVQRQAAFGGGIVENQIYNAPLIRGEQINTELPFLANAHELIVLNSSPLEVVAGQDGVTYTEALRTSPTAWEMAENIDLMRAQPPGEAQRAEFPLAILAQGTFSSYFADREIPEPPPPPPPAQGGTAAPGAPAGAGTAAAAGAPPGPSAPVIASEDLHAEQSFIAAGQGQLFVMGSSAMLGSGLVDPRSRSPNSMFALNLIDSMNGRDERALLRSKGRGVRVLRPLEPPVRTAIKTLAVGGLPTLVVLAGLAMWLLGGVHRRRIRARYAGNSVTGGGAAPGGELPAQPGSGGRISAAGANAAAPTGGDPPVADPAAREGAHGTGVGHPAAAPGSSSRATGGGSAGSGAEGGAAEDARWRPRTPSGSGVAGAGGPAAGGAGAAGGGDPPVADTAAREDAEGTGVDQPASPLGSGSRATGGRSAGSGAEGGAAEDARWRPRTPPGSGVAGAGGSAADGEGPAGGGDSEPPAESGGGVAGAGGPAAGGAGAAVGGDSDPAEFSGGAGAGGSAVGGAGAAGGGDSEPPALPGGGSRAGGEGAG